MKYSSSSELLIGFDSKEPSSQLLVELVDLMDRFKNRLLIHDDNNFDIDCNVSGMKWGRSGKELSLMNDRIVFADFGKILLSKILHYFN